MGTKWERRKHGWINRHCEADSAIDNAVKLVRRYKRHDAVSGAEEQMCDEVLVLLKNAKELTLQTFLRRMRREQSLREAKLQ